MKLWTAWADYAATGEGRTLMAIIAYAENAEDAKKKFAEKFSDYMALGCETQEGVVENNITSFLFSEKLFKQVRSEEHKAHIIVFAEHHFNKS